MICKLLLALTFPALSLAACLPVTGDRILAQDLVAAVPSFAALPGTVSVGYAPEPGSIRRLGRSEILSFARSHGILLDDAPEVCFAVPMAGVPSLLHLRKIMLTVLPPSTSVEIVEFSQAAVPEGPISFPLEGIEPPQPTDPAIQFWKGFVSYGTSKRFRIWARVRILLDRPEVVVTKALRQGDTVSADAVALEPHKGPMLTGGVLTSTEDAIGKTLLRSVRAGDRLSAGLLAPPIAIRRGDPVKVEVINGPAHLVFSAVAEANARQGEVVQLRNPASGKVFSARLDSPGKAVITLGKLP